MSLSASSSNASIVVNEELSKDVSTWDVDQVCAFLQANQKVTGELNNSVLMQLRKQAITGVALLGLTIPQLRELKFPWGAAYGICQAVAKLKQALETDNDVQPGTWSQWLICVMFTFFCFFFFYILTLSPQIDRSLIMRADGFTFLNRRVNAYWRCVGNALVLML
jgi:hypothetical protein